MKLLVKHMTIGGRHSVQVRAPDLYDDCLAEGRDADLEVARSRAAAGLRALKASIDRMLTLLVPAPAPAANPGDKLATASE